MLSTQKKLRIGLTLAASGVLLLAGTGKAHAPSRGFACYAVLEAPLPVAEAKPEANPNPAPKPKPKPSLGPERKALASYLSRRFYIAPEATRRMVATAYRAARSVRMDPLLVLAVISVESSFNPIAESVAGAKGLMQIVPRFHRAKLLEYGGDEAALDPESNILVGTRILHEYVYRAGTLKAGLQLYNGAANDESGRYAQKVLAERERFQQALRQALGRGRASLDKAQETQGS